MTVTQVEIQSAVSRQVGAKNIPIGYLRGFLVALVVAHHAVLAYHPFAPPPEGSLTAPPHLWEAFPVVDPQRWTGFSLLTGFNDVFFMALMFFLSGLFVWDGLQRKGIRVFLRDRLLRLGLPFIAAAAILAPLAYYPAYLQRAAHPSIAEYGRQWLSLGEWPAGPAWFVWVLLVFDAAAALLYLGRPKWGKAISRPGAFFGASDCFGSRVRSDGDRIHAIPVDRLRAIRFSDLSNSVLLRLLRRWNRGGSVGTRQGFSGGWWKASAAMAVMGDCGTDHIWNCGSSHHCDLDGASSIAWLAERHGLYGDAFLRRFFIRLPGSVCPVCRVACEIFR